MLVRDGDAAPMGRSAPVLLVLVHRQICQKPRKQKNWRACEDYQLDPSALLRRSLEFQFYPFLGPLGGTELPPILGIRCNFKRFSRLQYQAVIAHSMIKSMIQDTSNLELKI
jgi:hypothetical protein